jgi:DNA-binding beta-propeller fold protein YncE
MIGTPRIIALVAVLALGAVDGLAATRYYAITNDNGIENTVSVYELSGTNLELRETIALDAGGGNGAFGQMSLAITQNGTNACLFVSDSRMGSISALMALAGNPYIQFVNNYFSPNGLFTNGFGIGITVTGGFVYASYTGEGAILPSIGVWRIGSGCTLTFVSQQTNTIGLNDGRIDGMAATPDGKYLVVAYADGSVGSYSIGGGNISLIGQEIIAGNSLGGAEADGVTISSDGRWAIFGDFSQSNTTQLDVASIGSNGVLAPTTTYGGTGGLGNGLGSSGVQLSPDNRFVYVADSRSGQETTVAFDTTTGVITYPNPCLTSLHGYGVDWNNGPSQVVTVTDSDSGDGLYVSDGPSAPAGSYIALLRVNPATGCAVEAPRSPFFDYNSPGPSITAYSR